MEETTRIVNAICLMAILTWMYFGLWGLVILGRLGDIRSELRKLNGGTAEAGKGEK